MTYDDWLGKLRMRCEKRTQQRVAKELGISAPFLSDILHGKREAGAKVFKKLKLRVVKTLVTASCLLLLASCVRPEPAPRAARIEQEARRECRIEMPEREDLQRGMTRAEWLVQRQYIRLLPSPHDVLTPEQEEVFKNLSPR